MQLPTYESVVKASFPNFGPSARYKDPSLRYHPYPRPVPDIAIETDDDEFDAATLYYPGPAIVASVDPLTRAIQKLVVLCALEETEEVVDMKNRVIIDLGILHQQALDNAHGRGRKVVNVALVNKKSRGADGDKA